MVRGLERIAEDRRHLIARQVRVSSGFTWGREGSAGAVAAGVAPAVRRSVPEGEAATMPQALGRLARLLRGWPEGEPLPSPQGLALRAGLATDHESSVAVHRLVRALAALQAAGVVRTVAGTRDAFMGQRVVLLCESGRLLRTEGAPAHWDDRVRAGR